MFFQNPFDQEFRGNLVLGDRQYVLTYLVPPNRNQSDTMIAWNFEPYDFSVVHNFTMNYAWDVDFKNYSALTVNVAGAVPAATTALEVVGALNANATFSSFFVAHTYPVPQSPAQKLSLKITKKSSRTKSNIKVYIDNTSAETKLGFNAKAGVNEIPSYFERHTIANRFTYPDSLATLVKLDPANPVDAAIITAAGFDPLAPKEDWQLLTGRSGIFTFQKLTVDTHDRITTIIEYPAGAVVGDFSRQIDYVYTGTNTRPDQITEIPHVLASGDLVTP